MSFFGRIMKRWGLNLGDAPRYSDRSLELQRQIDEEMHRTAAAAVEFNKASNELMLRGIENAQVLTEARLAVKGVADRLSPMPERSEMGNRRNHDDVD